MLTDVTLGLPLKASACCQKCRPRIAWDAVNCSTESPTNFLSALLGAWADDSHRAWPFIFGSTVFAEAKDWSGGGVVAAGANPPLESAERFFFFGNLDFLGVRSLLGVLCTVYDMRVPDLTGAVGPFSSSLTRWDG